MTRSNWDQAKELFLELADQPADQREDVLQELAMSSPELVASVRELLRHDQPPPPEAPAESTARFGPYEVTRPIGRGGMGEVFAAKRADGEYESEVAIKLLREGTVNQELVQRFLRERQTLARLDHEYIARLLDGGTTPAGEPYLVMEYVEGIPADTFAARLELKERLELFMRIGEAVAHAHERGFVHRDLKPSNILVRPDGTPRLLDFGIARPDPETHAERSDSGPLTRTGHRLFTPEYASPEQIRGEVATAQSDLFAMGVLLHVFLCDRSPWREGANMHELERIICEEDPPPPSRHVTKTARMRLAGDLDAICLQCLAKRPEHRYESVGELCADLERHLSGRPIRARRIGTLGRAARFARRNPAYPVGIVLALAAVLSLGAAWNSERRGDRRRDKLSSAVADRIEAADLRWSKGEPEAAHAELEAALLALKDLPDEQQLHAEVLAKQAVYANLQRDWSSGLLLIERAQAIVDALASPEPRLIATLLTARAYALHRIELGEESRQAAAEALAYAQANLPPGDVLRVDALMGWTDELRSAGRSEEALSTLRETVVESRQGDPKSSTLSRLLNEEALALATLGRFEEAVESYREALTILAWNHGERHDSFAKVRLNLGTTLFRLGRFEEAKEEHEGSLATCRYLDLELLVASNLHFLGRIHLALGDFDAAEEATCEAIDIRERHGQGLHTERSRCLHGIILARTERQEEARDILAPLLASPGGERFLPSMEAEAQHLLGDILDADGERRMARRHLTRALELKGQLYGLSHPDCLALSDRLAQRD